jgi:hypothetical protein
MMLVFRAGKRIWQSGNYVASLPYFFKAGFRVFY